MAYSKTLWDVISGNFPGGQNYNPATSSVGKKKYTGPLKNMGVIGSSGGYSTSGGKKTNDITRLFGLIFGGRDPVTGLTRQELQGKYGIKTFGDLENRFPSGGQRTTVERAKGLASANINDFDSKLNNLIIKAHNLDPNRFKNETNWMINYAKKKIQSLPMNQRRLIADPNVPDAQKVVLLKQWTDTNTLNDVHERANQRRQDLKVNPYKSWSEYQQDLDKIKKNNVSNIYAKYWTPDWDKNQQKYGTAPTKKNYYNAAWGPPETTPWAIEQIQRQAKGQPGIVMGAGGEDLGLKYKNWTIHDYYKQREAEVNSRQPFTLGGYLADATQSTQQTSSGGSPWSDNPSVVSPVPDSHPIDPDGTGKWPPPPNKMTPPAVIEQNPPPPNPPSNRPPIGPPPPIYGGGRQTTELPQNTTTPPGSGGSGAGYGLGGLMSNITNALQNITSTIQQQPTSQEQDRFNRVLNYIEHSIANAEAPGTQLYTPLKEKWKRQTQRTLRQALRALANRGILQSSTAGRILGDVAGQSRDAFANLLGYIANLNEGARRFNLGTGLNMANSLLGMAGLKEGSRKTNLSSLLGAGNLGLGVIGAVPAYLRGMYSLENIDPWKAGLAQEAYYNAFAQNELPANWQPNATGGNTVNSTNGMYSGGLQNNPYAGGGSGDFWNTVALAGLLGAF